MAVRLKMVSLRYARPVKIENGKVWVGNDATVMRAEAS